MVTTRLEATTTSKKLGIFNSKKLLETQQRFREDLRSIIQPSKYKHILQPQSECTPTPISLQHTMNMYISYIYVYTQQVPFASRLEVIRRMEAIATRFSFICVHVYTTQSQANRQPFTVQASPIEGGSKQLSYLYIIVCIVSNSFLLLVVRPGAPSSFLFQLSVHLLLYGSKDCFVNIVPCSEFWLVQRLTQGQAPAAPLRRCHSPELPWLWPTGAPRSSG